MYYIIKVKVLSPWPGQEEKKVLLDGLLDDDGLVNMGFDLPPEDCLFRRRAEVLPHVRTAQIFKPDIKKITLCTLDMNERTVREWDSF